MRALITGAGGQLGSDLQRLLPNAIALAHTALSITDARSVREALVAAQPDVLFNCAAFNAVDRAEEEVEAARVTNALGPRILAAGCASLGVRLVHFSTNFVFDGELDRPYRESDQPRPQSVYAQSKRDGEIGALDQLPDALVIRSAGLFGRIGSAIKGGSFPERILKRAGAGEPIRVVADQFLNPTYTLDLARATLDLVENGTSGTVHVVAAGCCSFQQFAQAALELAGLDLKVEPITTAELAAPAARPRNGCLESDRVAPLRHWREGLADLLREAPATSQS